VFEHQHRQWARPKRLAQQGKRSWQLPDYANELGIIGDMHDERIVGWAPFGSENCLHSLRIAGITGEAIDSFGWHRNNPTPPNNRRCAGDCDGVWVSG
jgi:hypothetical protein